MGETYYQDIMEMLVKKAMQYRFCVAPNPTVGACLLYQDTIVAEGYHTCYGGKHAEIICLEEAAKKNIPLEECTLVLTLEPCVHYGKTPPCIQQVIESNIQRIVIGAKDPHNIATGGAKKLQDAGREVILLEDIHSQYCIQDFTMWKNYEMPHCILKLATTIDGYIATRSYKSQWITNEQTRAYMHRIRSLLGLYSGAILVGANTVRYDNPKLYAPDTTHNKHPRPVIITRTLEGLDESFLCTQRAEECIIITCSSREKSPLWERLQSRGVSFIIAGQDSIDIPVAFHRLYKEYNILYLLCEGGGILAQHLLAQSFPLELWHCVAPCLFADAGAIPMATGASPHHVNEGYSFRLQSLQSFDSDIMATYIKYSI